MLLEVLIPILTLHMLMQCKMLLFCANTVVRELAKFELAHLKKEEETIWRFGDFLVW